MSEQQLLLFDYFWSEFLIFSSKPKPRLPSPPRVEIVRETSRPVFHPQSTSETDVAVASFAPIVSPDSVLSSTPEKVADDFFVDGEKIEGLVGGKGMARRTRTRTRRRIRRTGIARTCSKSLSELEFEELKGFMDLGFVFSERARDSDSLTSIIPELHRLGEEGGGEIKTEGVSRPYLSEAWGAVEVQRKMHAMKWRASEIGKNDERAMKDQLKSWAYAVASTVYKTMVVVSKLVGVGGGE